MSERINLPYVDLSEWKDSLRKGAASDQVLLRKGRDLSEVRILKAEGEEDTVRLVISTGDEDRSHDVIDQAGWDLSNFHKNPVVLFGHDYYSPPVAKAPRTYPENGVLVSLPEFCPPDLYPFGNMVGRMVKAGFLNASSVGFRPRKYAINEERGGVDFQEQELMEYSIVCVPDNPKALQSAKDAWGEALTKSMAAGLDVTPVVALLESSAGWLVESGLVKGDPEREAALRVLNRGRVTVSGGGVLVPAAAAADQAKGARMSKANETAIREAYAAAEVATSKLRAVLDNVEAGADPAPASEAAPDPKAATPPPAPAAPAQKEGEPPVRLVLAKEPDAPPKVMADPKALAGLLVETFREVVAEQRAST